METPSGVLHFLANAQLCLNNGISKLAVRIVVHQAP